MKYLSRRLRLLSILLFAAALSGCQLQIVTEESALKAWFWSRFGWATLVTVVLGAVAAKFFCRLPIRAPRLDCIAMARRRFAQWIIVLALVIAPAWFWFDALMTQPFGEGNQLSPLNVFLIVTLDWSTLLLMLVVAAVFYLSVAAFTRAVFRGNCNCRYAFIPKSRG
jgi:hypothetical protein